MKKSDKNNPQLDVNLTISSITVSYDNVKTQLDIIYSALQLLSTKKEFLELTDPLEILEQCKRIKGAQANFCEAQIYFFEVLQRFATRQDMETKLHLMSPNNINDSGAIINDMINNASKHVSENINRIINPPDTDQQGSEDKKE